MAAKIRLGVHEAMVGLICPDMAKVDDTVEKRMYEELNSSPMPMLSPMPPLILRDDSDAPIIVRMKAASRLA